MDEDEVLYENGDFWVCREEFGTGRFGPTSIGYAVYEQGITHSKRVASIGYDGDKGLLFAISEIKRRISLKLLSEISN
jgi:hypothetical protein